MSGSWFKALTASAFSTFVLVLSVWGVDDRIKTNFPKLAFLVDLLPIAAILTLLATFILFFLQIVESIVIWFRTSSSRIQNITADTCKEQDLPALLSIANSHIGSVADLAETTRLYRHNKHAFKKIIDTRTQEILGYFCLFPLTEYGLERVTQRNLLQSPVDLACFATRFRKGNAAYIGGVAGIDRRGRAGALEQLRLYILQKNCMSAYARPMTKQGVKLARQYDFKPVAQNDRLIEGVYAFKMREI
ncbi:hypothetical protein [Neorhizobium tomejilense]|uniref:hypothetical protein n=1 Tax=Neorhizobium tomejilense TaxID=2093828 RepID=UPI000CF840BE|nr:hypothetical protein [Neorhizobium tomejilense]